MNRKQSIKRAALKGPTSSYPIAKQPLGRGSKPKYGGPQGGRPGVSPRIGAGKPVGGERNYLNLNPVDAAKRGSTPGRHIFGSPYNVKPPRKKRGR